MTMKDSSTTIVASLHAMLRQEEDGCYLVPDDFLHQQDDPNVEIPHGPLNVDAECRTKISCWCYQVADYGKFGRETVEIAMNYLDRFVMTPQGRVAKIDREFYQRAAMTCIYMAVKIHEPLAMALSFVTKLSRGTFAPDEVAAMEIVVLEALKWRLNPPTTLSFVRMFLQLIPQEALPHHRRCITIDKEEEDDDDSSTASSTSASTNTTSIRQTMYEITKYQVELAVNEYVLVGVKPSMIAYCALKNAFESCIGHSIHHEDANKALDALERIACQVLDMEMQEEQVDGIQEYLYEAVVRNPSDDVSMDSLDKSNHSESGFNKRSSFEESPRSTITASAATAAASAAASTAASA